MKKKITKILCLLLAFALCFGIGATAAVHTLLPIQADLNYDIHIFLNGTEQKMFDANGKRVYPISYEGTTYLPIRAVSSMLGVNVDWDAENYAVLLSSGKATSADSALQNFYTNVSYANDLMVLIAETIAGNWYDSIYKDKFNNDIDEAIIAAQDKCSNEINTLKAMDGTIVSLYKDLRNSPQKAQVEAVMDAYNDFYRFALNVNCSYSEYKVEIKPIEDALTNALRQLYLVL